MNSAVDNRAMPQAPLTGVTKRVGEPTAFDNDMTDVTRAAIAELRARGHRVRSVELTAWSDVKTELAYRHVIDLPRISEAIP